MDKRFYSESLSESVFENSLNQDQVWVVLFAIWTKHPDQVWQKTWDLIWIQSVWQFVLY